MSPDAYFGHKPIILEALMGELDGVGSNALKRNVPLSSYAG
jgi:hypothetical protein